MIKAVIYDLDDLMVNSIGLHKKAWNVLFAAYGVNVADIPAELESKFVGMRVSDILEKIVAYFKVKADLNELYQNRQEIFLKLVESDLEAMPGLIESLEFCRTNRLKTALATSATKKYYNLVLDKFAIRNYFDAIVCGDDVKKGKPDPETYLVACQKLGLAPADCLVLEDAANGITSAKAAGCKCVAVRNSCTPPQDLGQADVIIDSLNGLNSEIINSLE